MDKPSPIVLKLTPDARPLDVRELWRSREILFFLTWRDIKIRYRQTIFGLAWALLQPLAGMLVFTFFFHRLAGIQSAEVPYPLFAYTGLTAWTFFSNAVSAASNSLVSNQPLITKVYFPRIFLPLGSMGAILVDLTICTLLAVGLIVYFGRQPGSSLLLLPVVALCLALTTAGPGLLFAAINVRFRDVKYVVPFLIQMGLFVTPVIYPVSFVPEQYRTALGVNPMAGMVELFRHALLGTPVHWGTVSVSLVVSVALLAFGLLLFQRFERRFSDVI